MNRMLTHFISVQMNCQVIYCRFLIVRWKAHQALCKNWVFLLTVRASSWRHVLNVTVRRGDKTCCFWNRITKKHFHQIEWNFLNQKNKKRSVTAFINLLVVIFMKNIWLTATLPSYFLIDPYISKFPTS